MSDLTPIQSAGLAFKTAFTVAAIRLGYESGKHPGDLDHPDVDRAQRNYEDADQKLTRWIVAVERVLETEVGLLPGGLRAGRSENVVVTPDNLPDAGQTVKGQKVRNSEAV